MYNKRIASTLLALLAGCAPAHLGSSSQPQAGCRATLRGGDLTTVISFPSGARLEGQWSVLGLGPREASGSTDVVSFDLALLHLAKADSASQEPTPLPLYRTLRLRASGPNATDVIEGVAETWCNTVLEADRRGVRFDRVVRPKPGSVT